MNKSIIARLLLPVLLLAQPGAAALGHAAPVEASDSGAMSAPAGHCARSKHVSAVRGQHGDAVPSHGADDPAPAPNTGCRAHSTCTCDCTGTSAIAIVRSDAAHAIPDHPAVIGIVAPRIEKRVVELLRPPI